MGVFGEHLKDARAQRGVSLRQIADATKISMGVLEALEREDFSRLPGGIFSRAFVRAYALQVGLDPEDTVREFLVEFERSENEAAEAPRPEVTSDDREFLERQRKAARVLKALVIGLLLLVGAVLLLWQFKSRFTKAQAQASPAFWLRPWTLPPSSSLSPLRPHLRQPVHVDGGLLALVVGSHRLEQLDRAGEIALDRGLRRLEIEPLDLVEGRHGMSGTLQRDALWVDVTRQQ
jgi:transcriptional regulator with XRE-family HTH domain